MPHSNPASFALTTGGPLRLYSTDELLAMPPPTWLIQDVLPAGGFIGLYGPPGCGKSFVALDMALAVASGVLWQGRMTQPGWVVYVSAEGTAGLGMRVLTWLRRFGLESADVDIAWLPETVPIHDDSDDLGVVFERIEEVGKPPALVIVDTLARCFDGDENQQVDMGRFVRGCDLFRRQFGSTVIAVHHTNSSEGRERGNTAFRGAADTMIAMAPGTVGVSQSRRQRAGRFTLSCSKQKEAKGFNMGLGRLVPNAETRSATVDVEWLSDEDEEAME